MKLSKTNCWVLGNYRCGSIFLCKFLEKVKADGKSDFYEKFNGLNPKTLQKYYGKDIYIWNRERVRIRRDLFFKYVMDKKLLPNRMKIMRDQFISVCGLRDSDKGLIESLLPDLKYIYIKRDDIYSCAVSNYFAQKTAKWVLRKEDREAYLKHPIPFNEKEMIQSYNHMKYYVNENGWENFLKDSPYMFINFKEMIADPVKTFTNVLEYLEVDFDGSVEELVNNFEYVPTKRPETKDYIQKLKEIIK